MSTQPWLQSPFSIPGQTPLLPGLFAPQEGAFGITVPAGDPSKLDQAAGLWAGMADIYTDQAAQIRSDAATMTGTPWSGEAGTAFAALAADVATWFNNAGNGCRTAAAACRQLATALRDAQKAARDAIRRATDADSRQQAAHKQLEQANTRADTARSATTDAQARMLLADQSHPVGQAAYQSASQDQLRAQTDLATAQTDALHASGQKSTAQTDLKSAQADGSLATTQIDDAARQASAAFEAAGRDLLSLTVCLATAPVPIDPARTDKPDLDVGAPGLAGLQPIGFSPANMRSQQLFKDYYDTKAAEEKEAAEREGNVGDAVGGVLSGFAGFHLFGNKDADVYKREETFGTVLGFLPSPALVESIGSRVVIKGGARVVEKDVAKQGEKALVKEGAGGVGPVRMGAAGEDAVRKAFPDALPIHKTPIDVAGHIRIPDGLTPTTLSEVKNVNSLSYTSQLRDFNTYATAENLKFDLYIREATSDLPATTLSKPLQQVIDASNGRIRVIRINLNP
jgi:Restriction endonuclease fold toxin 7